MRLLGKQAGGFLFCFFGERMWCGTWLWPDLVSLVSVSKACFIQETTGGRVAHCANLDNKGCVELVKANHRGAHMF